MNYIFLFSILFLIIHGSNLEPTFGVPPQFQSLYSGDSFKCDENTIIDISRVNDGICDCPNSGRDEPGTSACSAGQFWCENQDHEGHSIPSSRVNDLICDCCDGADEYLGYSECPNICSTLAEKHAEERELRRLKNLQGLILKNKLIQQSQEKYQNAFNIERDMISEQTQLENQLEIAENQLKHYKESYQKALDLLKQLKLPNTEIPGMESDQQPLEDYELEDDPSIAVVKKAKTDVEKEIYQIQEDIERIHGMVREAQIVLGLDSGPEHEWLALQDECFDYQSSEYTYTLCMFGKFTQTSSKGGAETLLGTFEAFNGPVDDWRNLKYTEAYFGHGKKCFQGTDRSVEVVFECGMTRGELVKLDEPSICKYEAIFETALACEAD